MLLLEREGFDGMAMEEAETHLYRGKTCSRGQDLSIWGLVTKKKLNASKNCGILTRKDLEDTRELIGHERG